MTESEQKSATKHNRKKLPTAEEVAVSSGWTQEVKWDDTTKGLSEAEKLELAEFFKLAREGHRLIGPHKGGRAGGMRMEVMHKETKKFVKQTSDPKLHPILAESWAKIGGLIKPPEGTGAASPSSGATLQPLPLVQYVAARAEKEIPVVRNMLGKISWIQNSFYDLGVLTFFKITQTPGLLPPEIWKITLSDGAKEEEVRAARELFVKGFEGAFGTLIRAQSAGEELLKLDYELDLLSGRFMVEKKKALEEKLRGDYFEQAFKTAQSCLCATDSKELLSRLVISGLVEATTKGQTAINTQIAEEVAKKE